MSLQPYILLEPTAAKAPLVVDSPHSGRIYPADFAYVCPLPLLRQTEDSYVDELVAGAREAGATVLTAEFPRSYMDANRAENDIDPALLAEAWPEVLQPSERTLQGLGLVRRLCKSNVPVYAAPLTVDEIKRRIATFYRPYHAALAKVIEQRVAEFGECYLINAHSMPGQSYENRMIRRPDFVLGDRDGTSCDLSFTRHAADILQDMGYSVALNDPYKGVEIVRRYGKPQAGQHALQLEINRRLYMNEQTLEKTEGFAKLQKNLTAFFQNLATEVMSVPDRLAAE
jgi:N-formylglutamate amidohydrolase